MKVNTNFLPTATIVSLEQPAYTVRENSVVVICVQRSSSGIYPLIAIDSTINFVNEWVNMLNLQLHLYLARHMQYSFTASNEH